MKQASSLLEWKRKNSSTLKILQSAGLKDFDTWDEFYKNSSDFIKEKQGKEEEIRSMKPGKVLSILWAAYLMSRPKIDLKELDKII